MRSWRARNANGRRSSAVDVIGGTAYTQRDGGGHHGSNNYHGKRASETHVGRCGRTSTDLRSTALRSEKQTNGLLSKRNAHMIGLKINFRPQCRQRVFRPSGCTVEVERRCLRWTAPSPPVTAPPHGASQNSDWRQRIIIYLPKPYGGALTHRSPRWTFHLFRSAHRWSHFRTRLVAFIHPPTST